jgi:hypothetical protein
VSFALPPIKTAGDTVTASSSLLEAVAAGEVTPDEAGRVMALLSAQGPGRNQRSGAAHRSPRGGEEMKTLERRVAAMETGRSELPAHLHLDGLTPAQLKDLEGAIIKLDSGVAIQRLTRDELAVIALLLDKNGEVLKIDLGALSDPELRAIIAEDE